LILAGKIVNSGPVVIASRSGHYRQTRFAVAECCRHGTLPRGKPIEYSKNNNIHDPDEHYKWPRSSRRVLWAGTAGQPRR